MDTDKHRYKKALLIPSCVCRLYISSVSICVYLWLISFFAFTATTQAQVRPVYDRGAVGLMQLLKRLNTTASVLMIGAHPDDEDTALLTYLARGESARTAYLSLTRGDGGQNIIGPELGEALGVIRTEELLQARRLDGAEQYFTRAYDYGFSKTLSEAKGKWDEKVILCDTVRVIRNFRPLVVVSQFSGTPADGHGQHQFAGYISPLAVKAAADATQCKDAGEPWTVKKFYVRHRGTGEPTLRINTGKYDPLLGRSYFEIAMEARSQHKSQEQGVLELRGDQFSGLNLQGNTTKENNIFDGVDVSLNGMTTIGGEDEPRIPFLGEIQKSAEAALAEFDVRRPEKILPHLLNGYSFAVQGEIDTDLTAAELFFVQKRKQFCDAIAIAARIQIDALADSETIVAGEPLLVGVKTYSPSDSIKVKDVALKVPSYWSVTAAETPKTNSPANILREPTQYAHYFSVTNIQTHWYTRPYWLFSPREGDIFQWTDMRNAADETLPFERRPLIAKIIVEVSGRDVVFERDVEFRFADDIRGEIRRNVDFMPTVNVEMDQPFVLVTTSDKAQTKRVTMTVTNNSNGVLRGKPSLSFGSERLNFGRVLTPEFELKRKGEKTSVAWEITIPPKTPPGRYSIGGEVVIGNYNFAKRMQSVAYPHIQTHRFYTENKVDFQVIDLKTLPVKIGYITGSGDRVADAIRQMGFSAETIPESELASGNLSRFDTIVVGIRAYQVRPDVVANNQRLLDYASNGGTLIVQYQLPSYAPLAPFATQMGPRVVDENAAVNIVDPKHPIFNFPNKITDADFAGWVQERNLYNFTNFGAEYTGLLESHDAGEAENKGGLVIAKIGKGNYIYCSYSMFRQLPAGVPGAYRLFANLLSLPKSR